MLDCRIITLENSREWAEKGSWLARRADPSAADADGKIEEKVRGILKAVQEEGDEALVRFTREFDCPDFEGPVRLGAQEIAMGAAMVSGDDREIIAQAASNIRLFHEEQREKTWLSTRPDGTMLGQLVNPVPRAGLYVPGGKGGDTPLVSSLLMNAIPAQVAGVPQIAVCTPPRADGSVNPIILAAAHLLDIHEVYRVGGAWAVAAMALGTESVTPVDVIAGPGNIFVTTAKRLVQGKVGIDMIAGPSEVCVIADGSANLRWVAADLLSQAEHDLLASAVCIVHDSLQANSLLKELASQCEKLPRRAIAKRSLEDWGAIVVVPDLNAAIEVANMMAPEHLELCIRSPWETLPYIRNAGAVFLGHNSPEAVGDYFAGPNHVLPTLGTARFSSALSVQTFCKKTSIVSTSRTFVRENRDAIARLARLEGLDAHALSVEARSPNQD